MSCDNKTSAEIYEFFDNFDEYEKLVGVPSVSFNIGDINEGCDSLKDDNDLTNILSPDDICKKFKFLYSSLFSSIDRSEETLHKNNHCSFLIYWLNKELNGKDNNTSICVKHFYDKMKEKHTGFFSDDLFEEKVHNINNYDIENINTLFNLYGIKSRINVLRDRETPKNKACSHVKECYDKYKEGIIKCEHNCSSFYIALELFKNKYNLEMNLPYSGLDPCKSDGIVTLPDWNDILEKYQTERNKQLKNTTLTILIPTFGFILTSIFFKFTPFGQFLGKKIWKKNIMNTDYEQENVLLSHLSDVENRISGDGEYNLGYYSLSNS
ncbi:hypothetical protein, conserved [Plasmodium ovale]|uniref:PIR protein n=1 Tax=Plasmodium ovale TaxID=36330 RepID=A0A1C3KI49_PLAOA|nr:hypothetical protein, conserved [Plasmodium ovale]